MAIFGPKEIEVKKFQKFLKQAGVSPTIYNLGGNQRGIKYKGKIIKFDVVPGARYIREPSINQFIIQKLRIDGISQNHSEFAEKYKEAKRLARQVMHY